MEASFLFSGRKPSSVEKVWDAFWTSVASSSGFVATTIKGAFRRLGNSNGEKRATIMWEKDEIVKKESSEENAPQITCVMSFDDSVVASAARMKEVADLILSFPEEKPVIVLSAIWKTTSNLLLAGEKAVICGASNVSEVDELSIIRDLHLETVDELGAERSTISAHLEDLVRLLNGIATTKEPTPKTRDKLVSYGECMSTRIFATYMNKIGAKARQYDAFDMGFTTTDEFTNAEILESTYPAVARRLLGDWKSDPAIPIVTCFLGKGQKSCEVTTLGKGGND